MSEDVNIKQKSSGQVPVSNETDPKSPGVQNSETTIKEPQNRVSTETHLSTRDAYAEINGNFTEDQAFQFAIQQSLKNSDIAEKRKELQGEYDENTAYSIALLHSLKDVKKDDTSFGEIIKDAIKAVLNAVSRTLRPTSAHRYYCWAYATLCQTDPKFADLDTSNTVARMIDESSGLKGMVEWLAKQRNVIGGDGIETNMLYLSDTISIADAIGHPMVIINASPRLSSELTAPLFSVAIPELGYQIDLTAGYLDQTLGAVQDPYPKEISKKYPSIDSHLKNGINDEDLKTILKTYDMEEESIENLLQQRSNLTENQSIFEIIPSNTPPNFLENLGMAPSDIMEFILSRSDPESRNYNPVQAFKKPNVYDNLIKYAKDKLGIEDPENKTFAEIVVKLLDDKDTVGLQFDVNHFSALVKNPTE